ncbi:hypothetical protein ASPVEDRAFT_41880 [Aspergillus versicolor CBS 583.65]|uniref:Uncharacterized protein n=1 Tax=Aspergillus versicolor CBS 583.65 TaxID=1036611 RepID=A0A1L9PLG4_ASPVE|nr:uncharacterized protein ASPVEDRAFT_41880 [Aspergillus versicolor CBS 583.65]OJJ02379.1 hypothetical protein ASPVEDRAFT_41880 [Aspergillus versicolor CBS 583.65]
MSENPAEQVKDTVYAAASMPGEWVQQNVVNPIQSYAAGENTEESGQAEVNLSDKEHKEIDSLDREKIEAFLREKHKSNAGTKRK